METFLIIGGAFIFLAICIWASQAVKEETPSLQSVINFRTVARRSQLDPSALDDVGIDEESQPYSYLFRKN